MRGAWRRAALAAAGALLLAGCPRRDGFYQRELQRLERPGYRGQEVSKERIEELRQEIRQLRERVDRIVTNTAQLGVFHKMLAVRFMQDGMYREAYQDLSKAIEIDTANPILFYYAGVCAAQVAKSTVEERESWLERSRLLYRRAVDLDPGYVDALYGLAVLYVFELGSPREAVPLLERVLKKESKNVEAMLLLANAYYRLGRLEESLETYERAARTTRSPERRREAQENAERIRDELYGGG